MSDFIIQKRDIQIVIDIDEITVVITQILCQVSVTTNRRSIWIEGASVSLLIQESLVSYAYQL